MVTYYDFIAVPPGGWAPTDIGGCVLWLSSDPNYLWQDVAKTTPVTTDGDPVGFRTDRTLSTNDATQNTAADKPAWKDLTPPGLYYHPNGSSHYLTVANESNFDFERTSPFSIVAWVKISSLNYNNLKSIVSKMTTDWLGYVFYAEPPDVENSPVNLAFQLRNVWPNAMIVSTEGLVVPTEEWVHICVTYDGSSTAAGVHIYVDNVDQIPLKVTKDSLSATILNNVNLEIGHNGATDYPMWFVGYENQIAIYNKELSSTEVAEYYDNTYLDF